MKWAIRCKSQSDHDRMMLVFDALDIPVFINSRVGGFLPDDPFLCFYSGSDSDVIRVNEHSVLFEDKEVVEVEDAYEYLIRWKEDGKVGS